MGEELTFLDHLKRFIKKCKTQYGFKTIAIIPRGLTQRQLTKYLFYSETTNCLEHFDAFILEWEWWRYSNLDQEFKGAVETLNQINELINSNQYNCNTEIYTFQHQFGEDTFEFTEKQRAKIIDQLVDRVYLYSYHKNPCDCYNGYPYSTNLKNKFYHNVSLLANNNNKKDKSSTKIVPTFNAKFKDDILLTTPKPEFYDDNFIGCGLDSIISTKDYQSCDYYVNYSGQFIQQISTSKKGLSYSLSYLETIFLDQYELDRKRTGTSDNEIIGFCWFKYSLLKILYQQINAQSEFRKVKLKDNLKLNPQIYLVQNKIHIKSNKPIQSLSLYSIDGKKLAPSFDIIHSDEIMISYNQSGIYLLKVIYQDSLNESIKIALK